MGGGIELPIPYTEKAAYAHHFGLATTTADLRDFLALIGAMDAEYLKLQAAKRGT